MLSMSISPLWWSSFSETLGRRTIYLVSFTLFVLFNILAALSQNISMLVVTRLLGGGAAASVQAVGAGTIADIWEVRERGRAMGFFYLGPLMGPLFAPILGGVLTEKLGWRSTLWVSTPLVNSSPESKTDSAFYTGAGHLRRNIASHNVLRSTGNTEDQTTAT